MQGSGSWSGGHSAASEAKLTKIRWNIQFFKSFFRNWTLCHPWGKVSRHHTWCPVTPAPRMHGSLPAPPPVIFTPDWGIQTGDTSGRVTGWLLTYFPRGLNRARVQRWRLAHIRVMGNILRDAVTSWLTTREEKNTDFFRHRQKVSFVSGWGFCPKMDIYQLWEMTESGLRDLAWLRVSCDEIVHTQCAGECG